MLRLTPWNSANEVERCDFSRCCLKIIRAKYTREKERERENATHQLCPQQLQVQVRQARKGDIAAGLAIRCFLYIKRIILRFVHRGRHRRYRRYRRHCHCQWQRQCSLTRLREPGSARWCRSESESAGRDLGIRNLRLAIPARPRDVSPSFSSSSSS